MSNEYLRIIVFELKELLLDVSKSCISICNQTMEEEFGYGQSNLGGVFDRNKKAGLIALKKAHKKLSEIAKERSKVAKVNKAKKGEQHAN